MSDDAVLALHGNLGTPADWTGLSVGHVRAVDLWEYCELSLFEMAHELATTISSGMENPVLAGYSLGGRLALHAMAIHPRRWKGAIIASAHPGLECVEDRVARRVSDELWMKRARQLPWVELLNKWNVEGVLANSTANGRQAAVEKNRGEIAMAFETWSLGRQENLRKQLRGFSAPVLWIVGEKDPKFRAIGEEMADVFADFTLSVIPDCGHRVLGDECAEVMRDWLGKL